MTKEKEPKSFKYGDLVIKCHQCGGIQTVEELVTDGRAIYLFNREDSFLRLNCPECKLTMELAIQPSKNIDDELKNVNDNEEFSKENTEEKTI